jgi:hypothetical protein
MWKSSSRISPIRSEARNLPHGADVLRLSKLTSPSKRRALDQRPAVIAEAAKVALTRQDCVGVEVVRINRQIAATLIEIETITRRTNSSSY